MHQDRAVRPGLPDLIYGPNYVLMPLQVPEPGTPLQAFVYASKTSKNLRGPLAVDQRVARSSGFIAGNEPVTSLWGCNEWPFRLYEVVVDPADVMIGRGELLLRTTAFRVVREVPLEEVFGPRAGELGPIFDDVRSMPWLAPKGPPDPNAIARLVHEVYAAAGGNKKVRRVSVGVSEDWIGACTADQHVDASGSPAALINAVREARARRDEKDEDRVDIGTRVLRRILLRQSYARLWEAGWEAAYNASLRASMQQNRRGDSKAAKRTWAKLREKVVDRHDAARRAAMRTAQRMLDALPDGEILEQGAAGDVELTMEIRAAGLSDVATHAWNFSLSAMITAIDVLETPVHEAERSPSRPLLELFRMGLWPIGEVEGLFVVYTPTPASPAAGSP